MKTKITNKKRVVIVHGWFGNPKENWKPWLKSQLKRQGFKVIVPQMPEPHAPKISKWVSKLKKVAGKSDMNTYFVGHSIGCQTIMRYLEILNPESKIGGVVYVAPFLISMTNLPEKKMVAIEKPWINKPINFKKVSNHGPSIAIFSDNDYYIPKENIGLLKRKLKSAIIIEHKKGHFSTKDKTKKIPIAVKAIQRLIDKNRKYENKN